MKAGEYIRTLAEFVSGEIGLLRFKELVGDRLFELLQNPEMTDEKRDLSSIELYLHEAEEGLRDEAEVYAIVQFTLDNIILTRLTSIGETAYFSSPPSKLPYLLSRTFDIDPDSPDKQETITKDLSLSASM